MTDELNHRRTLVERQAAERGEVSVNEMTLYLKFAANEFGPTGLNEAMAAMTTIGEEVRAAHAVAYLRARGEIPESTQWAA